MPPPHGDADAGPLHGRCVVDAVADHCDLLRQTELGDLIDLALRQQAGTPAHAELTGDGLGGAGVVAGQHDALQTELVELLQCRSSFRPDLVAQGQQGGRQSLVADALAEHHNGLALPLQRSNPGLLFHIQGRHPARCQKLPQFTVDASFNPHARQGAKVAGVGQSQPLLVGGGDHGAGQRVVGTLLDGSRQRQQLGLCLAIEAHQLGQLRLAQSQGAGLVKGDGVDMGQSLQCGPALD